jgi:hypothetical protein
MAPNSGSIVRRRRSSIGAFPRRLESEYAVAEPGRCRGTGAYLNPENTGLRTTRESANNVNPRLEVFAVFTSSSHVAVLHLQPYLYGVQLAGAGESELSADRTPG